MGRARLAWPVHAASVRSGMASRHDALAQHLGSRVVSRRPLSGGDISAVARVELEDGRSVVAKRSRRGSSLEGEAEGLRWLAQPGALRVPAVVAVFDDTLVLEDLGDGSPSEDFDEALGRGLAGIHRSGAPGFGWDRDNLLAELAQDNASRPDWPAFYGQARLLPRARSCAELGRLNTRDMRHIEQLVSRLPSLVGEAEQAARLHGDLWSGNVHVCGSGVPALIDPAVYGGHREIDLAMLHLFGRPGPRFIDAYQEIWPLTPGHEQRRLLHQLYPLLVHLELFGGGYLSGVRRAVDAYL